MTLAEFFQSQLFGIILGGLLTGGFTLLSENIRFNREQKIYLKRKRESLYQMMYELVMRIEHDIRNNKKDILSKSSKDLWNEIQNESIYGKQVTMNYFYKLCEKLDSSFEDETKEMLDKHIENNTKILEFYAHIKKELGIKD
ncbi:MAG: hypothetical protein IKU37_02320 [Candidatus Gastranaerophilales bacterium]|nr:hypothetical protein [Candidatus Gastranaerophilales bacterium]